MIYVNYHRYLDELEGNALEVVLVPSGDAECAMRGGMIRAVQSENAAWYRAYCGEHESNGKAARRRRKFQTKIKRAHTIRALRELIMRAKASQWRGALTLYAQDLQKFLRRWARQEVEFERESEKEWRAYNETQANVYRYIN